MALVKFNFDAERGNEEAVTKFMRSFFEVSRDANRTKFQEFQRLYEMYKLVGNLAGKDRNRSNIFVPKLFSSIETIVPRYADALMGLRPYIPIELGNRKFTSIGDAQTRLLDSFLADDDSGFFWEMVKAIKYVTLYGTAFLESSPDYDMREFVKNQPQNMTLPDGRTVPIGMTQVEETRKVFQLKVRAYPPWRIFQDPNAKTVNGARGIIKFRGLVSKRQLKAMAGRGVFPDFDLEKLDNQMQEVLNDDWSIKMARDIGVSIPEHDDDLGVWLSYESEDRYIDQWNFGITLRDQDNPYKHKKINLTRIINIHEANDYNEWFGIGEGRPVENLCHAMNDAWNQTFDAHNMINQGVIYYDDEAISVDQLVMIGGNRIPVTRNPNERIEDAVHERPMQGLPRDHYAIPDTFDRMIDETQGVFEATRGETARKTQTAREALLLSQSAGVRMKLKTMMVEQMGLKDFAMKAIEIIDQFASHDDIVDRIGVEAASILPSVNPAKIEGGFSLSMKGSARMADAMVRRQDAKDVYQLMAGNPSIRQDWLANWMLERFEVSDEERRRAVLPDANALQLQALMAKMGIGGGKPQSQRLVSDGRLAGANIGQTEVGKDMSEELSGTI